MKRYRSRGASAPILGVVSKHGDVIWVVVFSLLLFFAMALQTGRMSVILAAVALVLSVGREPLQRMRERFCVPVMGLLAYALMDGLASIYGRFGYSAVAEFYKFIAAFSLAALFLLRIEKRHVRGLLWGFSIISAVIAFLCVDGSSAGGIFGIFRTVAEALEANYTDITVFSYNRINGIYNDANVTASIFALGALISIYLVLSTEDRRKRFAACFLLGISAQGFFLSMSRGAILCFALTLLVYLIAEGKETRLRLFLLMFVSAGVTMVISVPVMGILGTPSWLPDLLVLLTGVGIYLLDWAVSERIAHFLTGKGKIIAIGGAVLAAACLVYMVAAVNITGEHVFKGETEVSFARMLDVEAGAYTVAADWDGGDGVYLLLQTQTDEQIQMNQFSTVYNGPLSGAAFSIDTGLRVHFNFTGPDNAVLRRVSLSNGQEIPLDYPLLPSFLADRFQGGILSSFSFLQRVQYMKDAWKIFLQSPLIGHGLGSTENLYTTVQPYYYQSLFVHNHIMQVMCDMGLLGTAGFLTFLGGLLWLLLRRLREERDPLAAMLLSCWVMMNSHGLMEINFSVRAYLCAALFVLLLPVPLYAKPITKETAKTGGTCLCVFLWLYLLVFGGLLEARRNVLRKVDRMNMVQPSFEVYMASLETFVREDVFDHMQYQLDYIANAVTVEDGRYDAKVLEYVEELRRTGTYYAGSGLCQYYYLPGGAYTEMFTCAREAVFQRGADPTAWNLMVDFFRERALPAIDQRRTDEFVNGLLDFQAYLTEFNQGRMEEIVLTDVNQALLDRAAAAREAGLSGEAAYAFLAG